MSPSRPRSSSRRPRLLRLVVVLAAVLAVAVVTVLLLPIWSDSEEDGEPDRAALERLADRINADSLEREGIFVGRIEVKQQAGGFCVEVTMANPTAPNRTWLRDRYGPEVCPSRKPEINHLTTMMACPARGDPVDVPDVTGMGAEAAVRRLRAAGFEPGCNSTGRTPIKRYSPDHALIVRRMCRTRAPLGASIELEYAGVLPGGYEYAIDECD